MISVITRTHFHLVHLKSFFCKFKLILQLTEMVGKLLRGVEPELMDGLIQAIKDGDLSKFQELSGTELAIDNDEVSEEEISEEEEEEEV